MYQPIPDELTPEEEIAATILRIPPDQFPDQQARAELVRRALAGQDVYAYTPAGSDRYVVWVRQSRADVEARFRPMDWAALWRAGLQP